MSNSKRRRWVMSLRRMITAVFTVGFCFSLIATFNASAAASRFKIQSVKLDKLSETVEGETTEFNEQNIKTNVVFHNVGDAVKYTITLKNTDSKEHVIQSVTDNNDNPYVVYEYDSYKNTKVNPNDSFDFVVTAKYKTAVMDLTKRAQSFDVKFAINFLDGTDEIPLVPDTSGTTEAKEAITSSTTALAVFAAGLIVLAVAAVIRNKKCQKVVVALLTVIISATATASINALTVEVNNIVLTNNIRFEDRLAVTYVVDDEEEVEVKAYDSKITKTVPEKAGFRAEGWVLADGSAFDMDTPVKTDLRLIAKYVATSMAVNFHGNGLKFRNGSDVNTVMMNRSCSEKPAPTAISHTSNINDDGTVKVDEETGEDMNYGYEVESWDPIRVEGASSLRITLTYSIEFDYDFLYILPGYYETEPGPDDDIDFESIKVYPKNEEYAEDEEGNELRYSDTFVIPGNEVTFAFYGDDIISYYGYYATIQPLDAGGNVISGDETITVCENGVLSGEYLVPDTMENQIFAGWVTDPSADTPVYNGLDNIIGAFGVEPGDTVNVYAKWKYRHTVAYDRNDGSSSSYSEEHYSGDIIYLEYNWFMRDNYDFMGWSTDPNATTAEYSEGDEFEIPNNAETTVFYAVWRRHHLVHYDGNGADSGEVSDQYIRPGDHTLPRLNNFERLHYMFIGWSEDPNATTPTYRKGDNAQIYAPETPGEVTLYAVWDADYFITYDANGGEGTMESQYVPADQIYAHLTESTFTRELYQFMGWSKDPNATTRSYSDKGSILVMNGDKVINLYAVWRPQHKVIFDANGGEGTMEDQYLNSESSAKLRKNTFTREGFYFAGWSRVASSTAPAYNDEGSFTAPYSTPNETTFYAVWAKPYTIVYDGNGDDVVGEVNYTTVITKVGDEGMLVPSNFSREGYGFAGYSTDPDAASKIHNTSGAPKMFGPNETITLDNATARVANSDKVITLYAVWLPKSTEYTFQTFNKEAFELAHPNEKVVALEDERDGNVYMVAKLRDGKWWMTENSRLDFTDLNTNITAENTNNPSSSFLSSIATYKGKTQKTFGVDCEADYNYNATSRNCYNKISFSVHNLYRGANETPEHFSGDYSATEIPYSWYSYGTLFNFRTANGGYPAFDDSQGTTYAGDICPKGWQIPSGLMGGDIANLNVIYGGTDGHPIGVGSPVGQDYTREPGPAREAIKNWFKYPNNLVKSGGGGYRNYIYTNYVQRAAFLIIRNFPAYDSTGVAITDNGYNYPNYDSTLRGSTLRSVRCIAK